MREDQMTARRLLLFAATAAALVAALVGAGAGGARTAASDTLVVVSPVGPPSLDREQFGTATQQEVITNLMEPLLRFKPLATKDAQGVPMGSSTKYVGGVCVSIAVSKDGKHVACK